MRAIHQDSDILAAGERLRVERPGGAVSAWDILKELGGRGEAGAGAAALRGPPC